MLSENEIKSKILDSILDFEVQQIPDTIRFWMVRTKKGYFYHEFVAKKFVALAWNTITSDTIFSPATLEALNDKILLNYPEIKRPTLVANKCNSFINEIAEGDILVIPSSKSEYITFAYAGEYYEEESKTPELEANVIHRIESCEVIIDQVNCPYRKRRHIDIIRTVKNEEINYHLIRAISSYHGISNFDTYSTIILDHLFNCYTYNHNTRLVFRVTETNPITSRAFSGFLYSINQILLSTTVDEAAISTQASVHSIGDIVFNIKDLFTFLSDNYLYIIAIAVVLGGGKFLTVELPGIPKIINDIFSIETDKKVKLEELRGIELENAKKELELMEKISTLNVDPNTLAAASEILTSCSENMKIRPIEKTTEIPIDKQSLISQTDDEEEML